MSNTVISKDLTNKKLHVTRTFAAPLDKVWKAWTVSEILDKWWAPKPWKAVTKTMDFREGGLWLYYMLGPNGEQHWCRVDFEAINNQISFAATSAFCDENGNINGSMPLMHWFNQFKADGDHTVVEASISFDKEADMQAIITMGFEGGFSMGLNNLEELLAAE
jgi:uncharacterized protein YndB with AHSA1/START domain